MESWLILIITLILSFFISFFLKSNKQKKFPPGPSVFSVITSFLRADADIELIARDLKTKYGPIFNLRIGIGIAFRRPSIFVASHSLAYQALVQQGVVFSDRPKAAQTSVSIQSNQIILTTLPYGPTWRLLRRNIEYKTNNILHPSRTKSYSNVRSRVLSTLIQQLRSDSEATQVITLIEHFRFSVFCLLVLMCFGDKIDQHQVEQIKDELIQLMQEQESVFIPLIEARMKPKTDEDVVAYVDTLLDLEFPEEKRKFNQGEIVSLCSEFLTGGTDTTSSRNSKTDGVTEEEEIVKEEKMPYLKAVILEGLRRHPPGHFLQPHKDAPINFMVADMGLDPLVWENPLDFNPDRFLSSDDTEAFDIIGNKEIKMMPFGAGRRVCPGYLLALLHLEYFVANLVWHFEWKPVDGNNVDLSEKQEFTVMMKNPLCARIRPRVNQLE
ncbi:hypothetical protein H5410_034127 [Solanum commersonii]|uniref:Cytochrome P450 n=1 Tax=Solanum commersonii TaxID=4109 RepID=A0A9J5YSB3_SOLCO|nr:hypothetical protein H5410_034127 [Solanum commersonii]